MTHASLSKAHLQQKTSGVLRGVLDWIFPPVCAGCGTEGSLLCGACLSKIHTMPFTVCQLCGKPLRSAGVCAACQADPPQYQALRCYSVYEGIARELVHQLKYDGNVGLGRTLAQLMVPMVRASSWKVDLVVPIPLGEAKLEERGYNQAGVIARALAEELERPFVPSALIRISEAHSQVKLTAEARRGNVRGAFRADPEQVSAKSILLVDDVFTTGATMRFASEAIKSAGAACINALTFARAGLKNREINPIPLTQPKEV